MQNVLDGWHIDNRSTQVRLLQWYTNMVQSLIKGNRRIPQTINCIFIPDEPFTNRTQNTTEQLHRNEPGDTPACLSDQINLTTSPPTEPCVFEAQINIQGVKIIYLSVGENSHITAEQTTTDTKTEQISSFKSFIALHIFSCGYFCCVCQVFFS